MVATFPLNFCLLKLLMNHLRLAYRAHSYIHTGNVTKVFERYQWNRSAFLAIVHSMSTLVNLLEFPTLSTYHTDETTMGNCQIYC